MHTVWWVWKFNYPALFMEHWLKKKWQTITVSAAIHCYSFCSDAKKTQHAQNEEFTMCYRTCQRCRQRGEYEGKTIHPGTECTDHDSEVWSEFRLICVWERLADRVCRRNTGETSKTAGWRGGYCLRFTAHCRAAGHLFSISLMHTHTKLHRNDLNKDTSMAGQAWGRTNLKL